MIHCCDSILKRLCDFFWKDTTYISKDRSSFYARMNHTIRSCNLIFFKVAKTDVYKRQAYNSAYFVLTDDRKILYDRIDKRVDLMMQEGLLEEVNALRLRGLKRESVAMQGLGYKELFGYFEGEYPLEEAVRIIKRDTRHFAKRQLTWFRRERDVIWLDKSEIGREDKQMIQQMLTVLKEKEIIH